MIKSHITHKKSKKSLLKELIVNLSFCLLTIFDLSPIMMKTPVSEL